MCEKLLPLLFFVRLFSFLLVGFGLRCVFVRSKIFRKKKINWVKIVLIASFTILLPATHFFPKHFAHSNAATRSITNQLQPGICLDVNNRNNRDTNANSPADLQQLTDNKNKKKLKDKCNLFVPCTSILQNSFDLDINKLLKVNTSEMITSSEFDQNLLKFTSLKTV